MIYQRPGIQSIMDDRLRKLPMAKPETVWNLRDAALCFAIMFVITVVATTVSAWLS